MKANETCFKNVVPLYSKKENKRSERKAYNTCPLCMKSTSIAELEELEKELRNYQEEQDFHTTTQVKSHQFH